MGYKGRGWKKWEERQDKARQGKARQRKHAEKADQTNHNMNGKKYGVNLLGDA